jgi:hypothetical protein
MAFDGRKSWDRIPKTKKEDRYETELDSKDNHAADVGAGELATC